MHLASICHLVSVKMFLQYFFAMSFIYLVYSDVGETNFINDTRDVGKPFAFGKVIRCQ